MRVGEWLHWFSFKRPTAVQDISCIRIRTAVGQLAETYMAESKAGPEQVATLLMLKSAQAAMLSHIVAPLPPDAFGH